MYFGSVKFFKHMILTLIALLIIIPTIGCFLLGHAYSDLKDKTNPGIKVKTGNTEEGVYASGNTSEGALKPNKNSPAYQLMYPELCIKPNADGYKDSAPKTVYLTFDDGPSDLTPQFLDVLKECDVKATFFVIYRDTPEAKALYKRMIAEGHSIGVHSTSHEYTQIYNSVETFLDDFAPMANLLEDVTGIKPTLFRFPGGSINPYNADIYQSLIAEMMRRGYTYYDWNVSSGDAASKATQKSIYNNVINNVSAKDPAIVLMHDGGTKSSTLQALPEIIRHLKAQGYTLAPLTNEVQPAYFVYPN